ncbi:argininosuccinate lyase [Ornatilinea apprima]|uniref:argininosuccinate lyase n=1 Tax=Ornatilinea apprima TaxID=1134406 RepID=UPI000AB137E2|nr:argininosuccinate lyase [Ornatilinea apprima]
MKLWKGRLSGSLNAAAAALNSSLAVDVNMAQQDVRGSQAWARALARSGLITKEDLYAILGGLETISKELASETFLFAESDEDIHTAVERRLTELIGAPAGKLHTGRSRNDQVVTDFRLWMLDAIQAADSGLAGVQSALLERAEADWGVILPGYTHFQQAQPLLLSHWWMAHFWALQRDRERLVDLKQETGVLPLGCGALAGSGFVIDRFALAADLGFAAPAPNSVDAVSDRDFALDFLHCASMIGLHLSRLAEALILYSTREFGFITFADEYSTGSSLMPQKKNPDPMELVRGKSGVLIGLQTGLMAVVKATPSAYDKDLQEDKAPVMEAASLLEMLLPVTAGALRTLQVNREKIAAALDPAMLATDLADYLVEKGVPFREAYQAVGAAVRWSVEQGVSVCDLPLETWRGLHPAFAADVKEVFQFPRAVARRASWGGTAPEAVRLQMERARKMLALGGGQP